MPLFHLAAFAASMLPVVAAMKELAPPSSLAAVGPTSWERMPTPMASGQGSPQLPPTLQTQAAPSGNSQQLPPAQTVQTQGGSLAQPVQTGPSTPSMPTAQTVQTQGGPLAQPVQTTTAPTPNMPSAQAMRTQGGPLPQPVQTGRATPVSMPPGQDMQSQGGPSAQGTAVQTGPILAPSIDSIPPGVVVPGVPGGAVPEQFATQVRQRYERDSALADSAQLGSLTPPPPIAATPPPMADRGEWQTQMRMPAPAQPGLVVEDNAMANTYGFLRKSSNQVGSVVENVLGVEGSLDDMHKDLDEEYRRWMLKKKVLLSQRDKMKSEIARAKAVLLEQKQMREEKERVVGRIQIEQGQNKKRMDDIKEKAIKWKNEKQTREEEIRIIQCQTANIERIKQERVEAANKQTSILKDNNRNLQRRVFQLNKELNQLTADFANMKIRNNRTLSEELGKIEKVQREIQALEAQLIQQAQLEEAVQRARERVSKQQHEVVTQREKIIEAQNKCDTAKKNLNKDIENLKRSLNNANGQMAQCQELDAANQKLQAKVNECVVRKRSVR